MNRELQTEHLGAIDRRATRRTGWDADRIQVLADLEIGGRARKMLITANRNGFYYVLNLVARAATKNVYAEPKLPQL